MKLFIVCTILAVSLGNIASAAPTIDEKVYEDLAAKGTATVILHFKGPKTSELLAKFREEHKPSERSVHHDVLPNILETNANKHQAETLEFLKSRKLSKNSGSDYFQLWMLNQLIVTNADPAILEIFKNSNEITLVEADREYQLIEASPWRAIESAQDPKNFEEATTIQQTTPQWGVKDVGAPEAWAKGSSGQGVTVGVIDTGVRSTHTILKARYRSTYGWFDAINKKTAAYDDQGHGTHCAGTVLGTQGYGVAPNATLIACKALNSRGSGSSSALRSCGQFMLCPTDARGSKKDCSKKPKIVSNSWGSSQSDPWYNDITDLWIDAGIIAIFANGNAGSECSTTGSPADYTKAIAVGATTSENEVASFSSRGPASDGTIKPDISAPGHQIKSASHTSDTAYATMSGTSMATPHVAGVAALYCTGNPSLNQDQVLEKLKTGAKETTPTDQECGGVSDSEYPNNAVGQGKVWAPAGL